MRFKINVLQVVKVKEPAQILDKLKEYLDDIMKK